MIFIFYTLAAVLIYISFKSFRGGIDYLNYFKKELAKPQSAYAPFATIIAACKGLDEGLRDNLAFLLEQDYPGYEVLFVVDDETDSAVAVIEEVSSKDAKKAKLIVAPRATDSGQKIENLREAVLYASGESTVFVFVDSDARPASDWLRHLVAPLSDEKVGASTGYRWFISKNPSFAGEIRAVWNASIASALGPNTKSNFCWGGSMAIRRDTFEHLGIRDKWLGTLSDDYVLTRTLNAAKMPVYFVPQALTATVEGCTFDELLEFTTRQMKITRVYAPKLWMTVFFGAGLFNIVMIWALAIFAFTSQNRIAILAAIITLAVVSAASAVKSWLRLKAAKLILRQYEPELKRQFWTQNTLWLITPALFFYNCFAALLSRRMTWRGIVYKMVSPTETIIIGRTTVGKV